MRIATDLTVRVRLLGLTPQMVLCALIVDRCYERVAGVEAEITSVSDGTHGRGSLHFKGFGMDFRTRDVPAVLQSQLKDQIKGTLGPEFDVVLEGNHLHVEWDPDD